MNEENQKLPVEVFMRPTNVLVYTVINLENKESLFRDYYYEPCRVIRNDLNKKAGKKLFKVTVKFEQAQDTAGYQENFIEEDEILEDF